MANLEEYVFYNLKIDKLDRQPMMHSQAGNNFIFMTINMRLFILVSYVTC